MVLILAVALIIAGYVVIRGEIDGRREDRNATRPPAPDVERYASLVSKIHNDYSTCVRA